MGKNRWLLAALFALPTVIFANDETLQPRHPFIHLFQKPQHFSMIYPHLRQSGQDRDYIIGDVIHQIVLEDIREDVQVESITALGYILRERPASYNFTTSNGGDRAFMNAVQVLSFREVSKEEVERGKQALLLMLSLDSNGRGEKGELKQMVASLSQNDVQQWVQEHLRENGYKMHYYSMGGPIATNSRVIPTLVSNEIEGFVLTTTEREQECIYTIIKTMGTTSVFGLLKKKKMLTKLGDEIDGVPPLQFLGYIFTHSELPKYMPKIKASMFKWKNLVDGLGRTMKREYDEGKIQPQLEGFAKSVGTDYDKLKTKLDKRDPEGFVVELMKK